MKRIEFKASEETGEDLWYGLWAELEAEFSYKHWIQLRSGIRQELWYELRSEIWLLLKTN